MGPEPTIRVLAVDGEESMLRTLQRVLTPFGFRIDTATSGAQAVEIATKESYDVYLVDMKMEPEDGLWTCRKLLAIDPYAVVLIVSGETAEEARVAAFQAGATDYVVKPFLPGELNERIRLRIRQSAKLARAKLEVGRLTADPETRAVYVDSVRVKFSAQESELFWILASSPGRFFSAELLGKLLTKPVSAATARKATRRMRERLGACSEMICTSTGQGYAFEPNAG